MAFNDKLYRKIQAIARAANELLSDLDRENEEKANQERIRAEYNRLGVQLGEESNAPVVSVETEVKNPVVPSRGKPVNE